MDLQTVDYIELHTVIQRSQLESVMGRFGRSMDSESLVEFEGSGGRGGHGDVDYAFRGRHVGSDFQQI